MHNNPIMLHRWNGPSRAFTMDGRFGGWTHHTRENVYKLFLEGDHLDTKPIWIGRLSADGRCWFTAEHEIGAHYIDFLGDVRIYFCGRHLMKPGGNVNAGERRNNDITT